MRAPTHYRHSSITSAPASPPFLRRAHHAVTRPRPTRPPPRDPPPRYPVFAGHDTNAMDLCIEMIMVRWARAPDHFGVSGCGRLPASRVGLRRARARRRGRGAGWRQDRGRGRATCSPVRRRSRPGCGAARACRCSGVQAGTAATEAQVRAVFGRLEHPSRVDAKTGEPAVAGEPAADFQLAGGAGGAGVGGGAGRHRGTPRGDPAARPPRRQRKAVAYYDLTFSPVKSVSVYWAALLEAGRDGRGRERGRGAPGRGGGGDGLRRGAGRLRAVGLSRQDRVGAVGRGLRAGQRVGPGSAGTTRPAARSSRSCTAT